MEKGTPWKLITNPPDKDGEYVVVISEPMIGSRYIGNTPPLKKSQEIIMYICQGRVPGERYEVENNGAYWRQVHEFNINVKHPKSEYITHWDHLKKYP